MLNRAIFGFILYVLIVTPISFIWMRQERAWKDYAPGEMTAMCLILCVMLLFCDMNKKWWSPFLYLVLTVPIGIGGDLIACKYRRKQSSIKLHR